LKNALLPVIASGAFGWGVSDAAGLAGSEEHAADHVSSSISPAARIATNSFFIEDFLVRLSFANHIRESLY
jgi:hypothetical protein